MCDSCGPHIRILSSSPTASGKISRSLKKKKKKREENIQNALFASLAPCELNSLLCKLLTYPGCFSCFLLILGHL